MKILLKTSLFALSAVFLSGCFAPPKIERKYDDFSKQHVCSLESYLLRNEWGRSAYLTLKRDGNYVTGFIRVMVIGIGKHRLSVNPNVTFDVYKKNDLVESIKLKSTTIKDELYDVPPAALGLTWTKNSLSTFQIQLGDVDFRKIAYADHVKFSMSDGFDSMDGTITKSELEFFRKFDKECEQTK